ncbi:MAG TPA: cyclic nucleotide-binding domain-containing protein, partial [Verrucomicrobiae bacterium]|nr:cyclic nucleotide-binding domain-containing protein [Verrucomicrobiae bacterium]
AAHVPELKMFFNDTTRIRIPAGYDTELISQVPTLQAGTLRRIKVLAGLSDEQLTRFLKFVEVKEAKPFAEVMRQGQPGDAMFLILQGEVRVRMMIAGKESVLANLSSGDFFGEISLFDHGPRSADVLTNEETILLRISAASFEKMVHEAPELAAPFLLGMGKTLTARIRADNKRYGESVVYSRLGLDVRP